MLDNPSLIRFACFLGIFFIMAAWEGFAPRRPLLTAKFQRWTANLGIIFLNTILIRFLLASAALGAAWKASEKGWGLFNHLTWPLPLKVIVAIIILDFIIYIQHLLFHAIPVLWRLHMVHHSDLDLDVATGARFHPLEILLSMLLKIAAVILLGAPPLAVLLFEILLNGLTLFNHSNVCLPERVDRMLRWFVVTPDMHRVHHSILRPETNSNFGFNLSWWDRLMRTYRPAPIEGHTGMTLGLHQFQDPTRLHFLSLLMLPFSGTTGGYPILHPGNPPRRK